MTHSQYGKPLPQCCCIEIPVSRGRRQRTPIARYGGKRSSRKNGEERPGQASVDPKHLRELSDAPGIPSLPEPEFAKDGYQGFREEDDEFWRHFHAQRASFSARTVFTADDLECAEPLLDRNGNPAQYPAAAYYDLRQRKWIPTSEEQEYELKQSSPLVDPFYVREAEPDEPHSSLYDPDARTVLSGDEYMDYSLNAPRYPDMRGFVRKRLDLSPGAWRVIHLGTSSAISTRKRNVSCTALLVDRRSGNETVDSDQENGVSRNSKESWRTPAMFLVDAGEGAERQLLRCDWCMTHGFRWIRAIFITHLHGDHVYGLPNLLWSIGRYAQYRRRKAIENGEDGSDYVVRIFGPYGTRGLVRTSLQWTRPLGVRFSVSELTARPGDFTHLTPFRPEEWGDIIAHDIKSGKVQTGSGLDIMKVCPPPLNEEVRAEDIQADDDGLWNVWTELCEDGRKIEVVAAPLRHRVPCFGYVFREVNSNSAVAKQKSRKDTIKVNIDFAKARALGVHGTQYRVLRSGRSITVGKTGRIVRPEDVEVRPSAYEGKKFRESSDSGGSTGGIDVDHRRKVTILGDTCNSDEIAEAAKGSQLLVHEATFTTAQLEKAKVALHSTAKMAGAFARKIGAKKLALTHFSSRYEAMNFEVNSEGSEKKKKGGFVFVEDEAEFQEMDEGSEDENLDEYVGAQKEANTDDFEDDEDEDCYSVNVLVQEARQGYKDGGSGGGSDSDGDRDSDKDVAIVAAHDFMEHEISANVLEAVAL